MFLVTSIGAFLLDNKIAFGWCNDVSKSQCLASMQVPIGEGGQAAPNGGVGPGWEACPKSDALLEYFAAVSYDTLQFSDAQNAGDVASATKAEEAAEDVRLLADDLGCRVVAPGTAGTVINSMDRTNLANYWTEVIQVHFQDTPGAFWLSNAAFIPLGVPSSGEN